MDAFMELVDIIREIRKKCPWDSVQTHESLMECLQDETEEVVQSVQALSDGAGAENFCEELGDVFMLLVLNSLIAEEEGLFTLEDVLHGISEKMKFRHPHIFHPEDEALSSLSWEELKALEKAEKHSRTASGKS
jgi:tetrapyrrole methylase family protein/MazG family protein